MNKSKVLLRIAGLSAVFATMITIVFFGLGKPRSVTHAQADDTAATTGCTLATISGNYGFLENGNIAYVGTYNDIGIFESNGAGKYTLDYTQNYDGGVASYSAAGTYKMNSNCTGTMTLTVLGTTYPAAFVAVSNGSEVDVISKIPNNVSTWVLKKIN
jgi:hypothetical protein